MPEERRDVEPPAERSWEGPPDAFRRASVVLGVLWLELTSLFWMVHSGAFALMKEPRPASYAGTSKVLLPLPLGVVGLLFLVYRRQEDRKAGVRLNWLYFVAFAITAGIVGVGALVLALNLVWIASV